MKFPSLFTKIPESRKFTFTPRFYDAKEEERKEREQRIRKELEDTDKKELIIESDYRTRIAGSFKSARRSASRQKNPSATLLRIVILTFLALWLIAYLHFGNVAFYGLFLFIPFYLFLKFRESKS